MKAEKRPRRKRTRIPDLILLLIQVSVMILFIYTLINLNMLNFKWLVLIIALLFVLLAMFTVLMIMKLGRGVTTVKRVVQVLLIAVMLVGNHYAGTLTNTLKTITNETQTRIDKISLLTLADNDGNSIEDFNGKTIGLQTGTDKDLTEFALGKIDQRIEYGKYEYVDYSVMINDFLLGYDDAILINDAYIKMMADSVEGFAGSYKVIETFTREIELTPAEVNAKLPDEPFAVYLSGMDELGDPHQQLRSDVNILMLVDPVANHVTMISIPRDAYVPNPAKNDQLDKLTHTGLYSIDTTIAAAEELFGFPIDYYVKVSFSSLIEIVNTVDGITVNVPVTFCEQNAERSYLWDDQICLEEGERFIYGPAALALARHRASYANELTRNQVQQDIIKAIVKRMMTPVGFSRIPDVLSIIPQYMVTNMPYSAITNFVSAEMNNIGDWTFDSIGLTNGISQLMPTASVPDLYQDVMILRYSDVVKVYERYQAMHDPVELNDLKFDLNDLNRYVKQMPSNPNLVWAENYE